MLFNLNVLRPLFGLKELIVLFNFVFFFKFVNPNCVQKLLNGVCLPIDPIITFIHGKIYNPT